MTKLICSLMLTLLTASCLAPPVDFGSLKIRANGVAYDPVTRKPFTGRSAQYDAQKRMTSVHSFVNGKMEGPYTRWWASGKEREMGTLKGGKNWGKLTLWRKNGSLMRMYYFGRYRLLDRYRLWHQSGHKMVDWDRGDLECKFWSLKGRLLRDDKIDVGFDENTNKINFSYKIMGTDVVLLAPKDVTDVFVVLNETTYNYEIMLKITPEARKRIRSITAAYVGKMIAIYDGRDFMNPSIIKAPIDTDLFVFATNLLARDAQPLMKGLRKAVYK